MSTRVAYLTSSRGLPKWSELDRSTITSHTLANPTVWQFLNAGIKGQLAESTPEAVETEFCGPAAQHKVALLFLDPDEFWADLPSLPPLFRPGWIQNGGAHGYPYSLAVPLVIILSPPSNTRVSDGAIRVLTENESETLTGLNLLQVFSAAQSAVKALVQGVDEDAPRGGGVESIGELVELVVRKGVIRDTPRLLEPFITLSELYLALGRLETGSGVEQVFDRDLNSLRFEIYENLAAGDPAVIGAIVNRMLRLLSASSPEVLPELIEVLRDILTGQPIASEAIAAADKIADHLENIGFVPPTGVSIHEFVAATLGWYRLAIPAEMRRLNQIAKTNATDFSTVWAGTSGLLFTLGLKGSISTIVGGYLAFLVIVWRGEHR